MCLAVPGKVLSVEGNLGRVDFDGVVREFCLDLVPGIVPGCWVLVHAGFAIQTLEEEEAQSTLALLREWADFEAQDVLGPTERAGGSDGT